MTETRRLGRGLEALLGPASRDHGEASGSLQELAISSIRPNPYQPRTRLDETALVELTASIEASGMLQPVVVRSKAGGYELIAGERRWRAAQRLNWTKIPAVIKEVDDRTLLTLALIENLQRHDLSAIDEAAGYQRLVQEFKLANSEVARVVGRNRSTVVNLLRLLKLPADVQSMVHEGRLSEGHARALLGLSDDLAIVSLAREAADQQLSVREVESRVSGAVKIPESTGKRTSKTNRAPLSADVKRVEDIIRKRLGTDVRVTMKRKGRGMISISYYSNDDLARVMELILGEPFEG